MAVAGWGRVAVSVAVLAGVACMSGYRPSTAYAAGQAAVVQRAGPAGASGATGSVAALAVVPVTAGATGRTGSSGATGLGAEAASAAKPGNATVESATAALKNADAGAALLTEIAKLPPLTGANIDVARRSGDVRAHLDSVLRYYRTATIPVQKVGEPSDVLYAEQSESEATEIASLAFQAAKNTAALLNRVPGGEAPQAGGTEPGGSQAERINTIRTQAGAQLSALQAQHAALEGELAKAKSTQRATLAQQDQQVEGGIELQQAMVQALDRISGFRSQQTQTGLAGDIDRLQRSAPELLSQPVKTPPPPVLQSLAAAADAGVSTQASVLFQLLSTLHTIDGQTQAIDIMNKQAEGMRTPFMKVLRSTIAQGQALTQGTVNLQATPTTDAQDLVNTRKQFDQLTKTFQVLADAMLPLSQEAVLLDNARGTLTTWRATVDAEYDDMLRQLLIRVGWIALALIVLTVANRIVNRAAVKYVADLRRRRQLLLMRRVVFGFLTGLVLIFGFVTQFSSLATFAGFITAGIAVGLQSILLSVAAYFFIVGRYGVKVGDRITVAGVTGEVIEVGLVRFYVMELVGTGTALHSTARVAVFANSVLFQTGTPIYKQMPGTEYAWHELTAKLNSGADVKAASEAVLKIVNDMYSTYSGKIQAQHQQVESWMGTALPGPQIASRLQLTDGALQFAVLFPVEIDHAAEVDQRIVEELVQGMNTDGPMKAGFAALPEIKASVKS